MSWENFGYPVKDPCVVCKKTGDNKLEPRFGYVICEEHHHIPPAELQNVVWKGIEMNQRDFISKEIHIMVSEILANIALRIKDNPEIFRTVDDVVEHIDDVSVGVRNKVA